MKFKAILHRRIRFFIVPSIIISVLFIFYQVWIFVQLNNETATTRQALDRTAYLLFIKKGGIHGIHESEVQFYKPNEKYEFTCIKSMEKINFTKVNDDYCDCDDGTDEPGTSACANGIFQCVNSGKGRFPQQVPSSMVNDGMCDCCDGSDEWNWRNSQKGKPTLDRKIQEQLQRFQVPCPYQC